MLLRKLLPVILGLMLFASASLASAQTLAAYLGKLHCEETTSGSGDDQFSLAFAVLVAYDDGAYRSWADYLYGEQNVFEGYTQRGATIGKPLFSMSQTPPNLPAALEVKKPTGNIRFVRIALYAWERDRPFRPFAGLDRRGLGLQNFGSGTDWASGERWYGTDRVVTLLGTSLREMTKVNDEDDTIGHTEFLLLPDELNRLLSESAIIPGATRLAHATTIADAGPASARKAFTFGGDGSRYTGELIFVHGLREVFGQTLPVPPQYRAEIQNGPGQPWRLVGVFSERRLAEMALQGQRIRPGQTWRITAVN